jgi:osmotically-inducible protein OsmY
MNALIRAATLSICVAPALTACVEFSECGLRECSADAKISTEVRALLEQSSELGGSNQISVQTLHGAVYLRGLVSTPYQVAEAGGIAQQVPGVTDVQNMVVIDNAR